MDSQQARPVRRWWSILSVIALVVLASSAAAGWRLEIELRGWDGLAWVGYPHWAVPVGVVAFVGWATIFADAVTPRRRAAMAAFLLLVAVPLHSFVRLAFVVYFSFGDLPSVTWLGSWRGLVLLGLYGAAFAPMPAFVCALAARIAGVRSVLARLVAASIVWGCAPFLGVAVLGAVAHRGNDDLIHAVKTGSIIPFLVLSLGILFVPSPAGAPDEDPT